MGSSTAICSVVAAVVGRSNLAESIAPTLQATTKQPHYFCEQNHECETGANLGEEFTMLRVKRQRRFRCDVHVADKRSFFENAALIVAQDLSDATEFINETGNSGVGSTHHRAPIFYASKNGVGQMLTRPG